MRRKYVRNVDLPIVEFLPGIINMSGNSIPQDAFIFYNPFIRKVKKIADTKKDLIFNFDMAYYNTSSSMYMTKILKILKELSNHAKVVINWYYLPADEQIYELGLDYKEILKMDINLIKK